MIPLRDDRPSRRTPFVTVSLIVANLLFFAYELMLGPALQGFLMSSAFVPARLFDPTAAAAISDLQLDNAMLSMFLHGGFLHIAGNMLFLWIFGDNVEDRLGHFRFLLFYLLAGYAATYAHALAEPSSAVPTIGASGAIAGVLGAYLVLHPMARIDTLLFIGFYVTHLAVPAIVYLPVWFLIQFFSGVAAIGTSSVQGGGVAWWAHIGGFVAGPILLALLGGFRQRAPRRRRR